MTRAYLVLLLLNAVGQAAGPPKVRIFAVPVSISGTFRPLTVAIEGKILIKDADSIEELELNGQRVIPKNKERGLFFQQTGEDRIELKMKGVKEFAPLTFELPQIKLGEISETEVELFVIGKISSFTIGGKETPIESGRVRWKIPSNPELRYALEARGTTDSPGRFYDMVISPAPVEPATPLITQQKSPLARFSAAPIASFQSGGNASYSTEVAWVPNLPLSETIRASLKLGATAFKKSGGGIYGVLQYELLGGIQVLPSITLELGGGGQTWLGHGGTRAAIPLNISYSLPSVFLGCIDRLALGYTLVFDDQKVHQLKLGAGFSI